MSLKETLKKLLNIKNNNVFQFCKNGEKCQMKIDNQNFNNLCWKSLKLVQYQECSGYLLLYLKCLNNHEVVRKLINNKLKLRLINIKN